MSTAEAALLAIRTWCRDAGVETEQNPDGAVVVVLPGEQKLRTTVSLSVTDEVVTVNAFVIRHPDEHAAEVHRWLLERNRKIFGLAYALDHYGDVFLVGTLPAAGFDTDTMDRLMGAVLLHCDQVFNQLLEMGFASAITAEWEWRLKAGESTENLAPFRHLAPPE
ncbi:MAG: YbjN domain-containing protein [Actinobacteria bacterium]|nr:YbjN domain-containing protein [Actinomycetota bacterium]MCB9411757.1 YbjN domain-containing protein [Actinomycetota bacterium]